MSIISSKAERLYPTLTIDSTHDALAQVYTSDDLQEAYMAGASRKPTDEEIKAGANHKNLSHPTSRRGSHGGRR